MFECMDGGEGKIPLCTSFQEFFLSPYFTPHFLLFSHV